MTQSPGGVDRIVRAMHGATNRDISHSLENVALYEALSILRPFPHATQACWPVRHGANIIQGRWPCQGLRPFLPETMACVTSFYKIRCDNLIIFFTKCQCGKQEKRADHQLVRSFFLLSVG